MSAQAMVLRGLQLQPLGSYLAALGLLRVVSEQFEAPVRASWSAEGFVLHGVSAGALVSFMLDQYHPTALVAPWAGGSGFAEGEDTSAIDAISQSTDDRLASYRTIIKKIRAFPELPPRGLLVRDVIEWGSKIAKDERSPKKLREELGKLLADVTHGATTPDDTIDSCKQGTPAAKIFTQMKSLRRAANKSALASRCRNELPDECLGWIDASLILHVDDKGEIGQTVGPLSKDAMKPKLEFSRLFMQAIREVVLGGDRERRVQLAKSFLTGEPTTGLSATAAGLFEQGSAGGFNTGPGFESKDLGSPTRLVGAQSGSAAGCPTQAPVSSAAGLSPLHVQSILPLSPRLESRSRHP